MGTHSSIELLDPSFQMKIRAAISAMEADSEIKDFGVVKILPRETLRDMDVQLVYFMGGRMAPEDVQTAYRKVLKWTPDIEYCRKKITWTLESKHLEGKAADIAPSLDGKTPFWKAPRPLLERMGKIASQHGITWGGEWAKAGHDDPFHFEDK